MKKTLATHLMVSLHCFQFQNRTFCRFPEWHLLMDVKLREFFNSFYVICHIALIVNINLTSLEFNVFSINIFVSFCAHFRRGLFPRNQHFFHRFFLNVTDVYWSTVAFFDFWYQKQNLATIHRPGKVQKFFSIAFSKVSDFCQAVTYFL